VVYTLHNLADLFLLQACPHKNFMKIRQQLFDWSFWQTDRQEVHQKVRYPNVTSLYFATPLARLTPQTEKFPWDDLRKILHGDQKMAKVQNDEEVLPKV